MELTGLTKESSDFLYTFTADRRDKIVFSRISYPLLWPYFRYLDVSFDLPTYLLDCCIAKMAPM